jgi:GMP synthase (glutamine-hydrolysing)
LTFNELGWIDGVVAPRMRRDLDFRLTMKKLVVLDFGGQYAHLIATRIRHLGVYSEIRFPDSAPEGLDEVGGVILSGGPSSVYDADRPAFDPAWLRVKAPVLGLCYGHHTVNQELGGHVQRGEVHEFGPADLEHDGTSPLFKGISSPTRVWMSHGDEVDRLPPGFRVSGTTDHCRHAAVEDAAAGRFGLQFHPEVVHSVDGERMLSNFLDICGFARDWNMDDYASSLADKVRRQAEGRKVFLLVSGGVDSTVAFALLNKALGPDRVLGLHIDNGLMRDAESAGVMEFMKREGFDNLRIADASELFLSRLSGVWEPERKRKIIGDTFLDVQASETAKLGLDPDEWLLAQGTIYPDTIESGGTKNAATIKTHHNRVPAILKLIEAGKIVEPLAELYKDEVRALGEKLGIPHDLVWRHPFPGPGLGVRLLCQTAPFPVASAESLSAAAEVARKHSYAVASLPVRSVGVQGDGRTYAQPAVLQGPGDWKRLEACATELTNRVRAFNRVVWQFGGAAEFEAVEAWTTRTRLDLLRKLDTAVTAWLRERGHYQTIWQMPVVLLPVTAGGKEVVVLRPVISREAMTASFWEAPFAELPTLAQTLLSLGAGAVLWDVTHKPPGTIEWE